MSKTNFALTAHIADSFGASTTASDDLSGEAVTLHVTEWTPTSTDVVRFRHVPVASPKCDAIVTCAQFRFRNCHDNVVSCDAFDYRSSLTCRLLFGVIGQDVVDQLSEAFAEASENIEENPGQMTSIVRAFASVAVNHREDSGTSSYDVDSYQV